MTIFTRLVRPEHIKRALSWAVQIAISLERNSSEKNIKNQKEGEMIMINFTRLVRPDNIKRALIWATQIAISLAHKWWRKKK